MKPFVGRNSLRAKDARAKAAASAASGGHRTSYPILSLFCGAGGLDEGFHRGGFDTALAIDTCPDAIRTFNHNVAEGVAVNRDLSTLSPSDFLALVPDSCRPVGLIGGPPCQGFSRGNVCADPRDPRNLLPFRYASLLETANEAFGIHFFVFENVAGLRGPKHAPRLKRILTRFRQAGFKVFMAVLDACDYGVPQRRRRLFVVGLNDRLYPDQEFAFPEGESGRPPTVRSAIRHLPPPAFFSRSLCATSIPFHPNHWTMMPRSPKLTTQVGSDGRSFRRLEWDEVSPTVAYGNREIHVHPDGGRRLSVYEAMLLQGFPQDYELTGSLSSQVSQVCNAVPPPVAEAIARTLRKILNSRIPATMASLAINAHETGRVSRLA